MEFIIQYAEINNIDEKRNIVIHLTREKLYEELGISVKTINRTIKKLKESGFIDIVKGKISINKQQLELAKKGLEHMKE